MSFGHWEALEFFFFFFSFPFDGVYTPLDTWTFGTLELFFGLDWVSPWIGLTWSRILELVDLMGYA